MIIATVYYKWTQVHYDLNDIAFNGNKKKFLEMILLLADVDNIVRIEFRVVNND